MSRLFDALQNARPEVIKQFYPGASRSNPPRPGASIKPRESRSEKQFFELLERLRLIDSAGNGRIVGLIGLHGGEGASTLARDLANFLATQTGESVLLLETNPGARTQSLSNRAPTETALNIAQMVAATGPTDIGGSSPVFFASLLARSYPANTTRDNTDFSRFFRRVADDYSWIVVDCQPILGANADISVVAAVDATILVAEADKSDARDLRMASNKIRASGTDVLGLILNKRTNHVPALVRRVLERLRII